MKWATASMRWSEREGDYLNLKPTLRTLDKPILFIMSDSRADLFRHMAPIAKETPDFDLLTIPDSGHNMYMDQPMQCRKRLRSLQPMTKNRSSSPTSLK